MGTQLDELLGIAKGVSENKTDDALASLFGNESEKNVNALDSLFSGDSSDVHFCRECANFVKHPYSCRCAITGKETSPTDDCEQFEPIVKPTIEDQKENADALPENRNQANN